MSSSTPRPSRRRRATRSRRQGADTEVFRNGRADYERGTQTATAAAGRQAAAGPTLGPYETAYDVSRGYSVDRLIVVP
jgi:hypothetical protein